MADTGDIAKGFGTVGGPPEEGFPIPIFFVLAQGEIVFSDRTHIRTWLETEQAYWNQLTQKLNEPAQGHARNNANLLQKLDVGAPVETLRKVLTESAARYIPSTVGIGAFLRSMAEQNHHQAGLILSEIVQPGSAGWQNNWQHVQAVTIATMFLQLGLPDILRNSIQTATSDVARIEERSAATNAALERALAEFTAKYDAQVDDYETKAALKAPREYWSGRAETHDQAALAARKAWSKNLMIFLGSFVVLSLVLLFFAPAVRLLSALNPEWLWLGSVKAAIVPSGEAESIANTTKPFLVLGTLLGIGVWWLRQQLRDLRSHEHLAEDAAERVTMIETYAAMRAAKLETEDLSIILTALYRPSTTGFIDDGGPVTPIEVLLKGAKSVGDNRG